MYDNLYTKQSNLSLLFSVQCLETDALSCCVWYYLLNSGAGVPAEDQQLALALLVELAVQHGSLSAMLAAVRLLLTVSSDVDADRDNRLSTVLTHAPLVAVLRRFQALALSSETSDDSDVSEVTSYAFVLQII